MSARWHAARLAGPVLRALPPSRCLSLYNRIVGHPFSPGIFADRVDRAVWPHGFTMELDMSDWLERCAAITGLFYGFDTTRVLQERLEPGSVFLDIGGNLGFLSLTASAIVGEGGRVIYVEPNPNLVARFRASLARNAIRNVEVIEAAIGERDGETGLNVPVHHGKAQLAKGTGIRMVTGDSLLRFVPEAAPLFVKIDVEGYEEKILHGMPIIRARPNTMFLIEITEAWLSERGGGAKSLIDMMLRDGFSARHASLSPRGELQLPEIRAPLPLKQYDLLFARAP